MPDQQNTPQPQDPGGSSSPPIIRQGKPLKQQNPHQANQPPHVNQSSPQSGGRPPHVSGQPPATGRPLPGTPPGPAQAPGQSPQRSSSPDEVVLKTTVVENIVAYGQNIGASLAGAIQGLSHPPQPQPPRGSQASRQQAGPQPIKLPIKQPTPPSQHSGQSPASPMPQRPQVPQQGNRPQPQSGTQSVSPPIRGAGVNPGRPNPTTSPPPPIGREAPTRSSEHAIPQMSPAPVPGRGPASQRTDQPVGPQVHNDEAGRSAAPQRTDQPAGPQIRKNEEGKLLQTEQSPASAVSVPETAEAPEIQESTPQPIVFAENRTNTDDERSNSSSEGIPSEEKVQQVVTPSSGKKEAIGNILYYGMVMIIIIACILIFAALAALVLISSHRQDPMFIIVFTCICVVLVFLAGGAIGFFWSRMLSGEVIEQITVRAAQAEEESNAMRQENNQLQERLRRIRGSKENSGVKNEEKRVEREKPEIKLPLLRSSDDRHIQEQQPPPQVPETRNKRPEPQSKKMAETPVDPPDYEEGKLEHPHEKWYPQKGGVVEFGFGWRVIGASRRGYGHYNGKYREDDYTIRLFPSTQTLPGMVLVAIADGVSAKSYSRFGALAAAKGAVQGTPQVSDFEERLTRLRHYIATSPQSEESQEASWLVLEAACRSAMLNVIKWVEDHPNLTLDDLHSTLMVFLASPVSPQHLFVAGTQIGDGVLFRMLDWTSLRPRDRWDRFLEAQIQASGNEVQPFMRSEAKDWHRFFRCQTLANARCLLGMTDGIADDIEPPRDPEADPFAPVDEFYQQKIMPVYSQPDPARLLVEALGYHERQSFDDRTLICIYKADRQ